MKKNKEEGKSNFHAGLGIKALLKSVEFEKIPEKQATIFCPYCRKGIDLDIRSKYLANKTKMHHLKTCCKKPIGAKLKNFILDGRSCKTKTNIKKAIAFQQTKVKKTIQKYEKNGHEIAILKCKRERKKHVYICKKCLACDDQKKLNGECGGQYQTAADGSLSPGPAWWKRCREANGKNKIEEICNLSKDTTKSITEDIRKYEAKEDARSASWRANVKKRKPGKASTASFKKICEKARTKAAMKRCANLRVKVFKNARKKGHDPVAIYENNFKKNIYVCRTCLAGNKQERWNKKCQGAVKTIRGAIPPGTQWWKNQRRAVGKDALDEICNVDHELSCKITQQIRCNHHE